MVAINNDNLIACYRENIRQIEANIEYEKNHIIGHTQSIESMQASIKNYENRIKELENERD